MKLEPPFAADESIIQGALARNELGSPDVPEKCDLCRNLKTEKTRAPKNKVKIKI